MAGTLILCPTFDHADALLMSISSVRAQSVTDWRMVVICDGAPARTVEVLQAIEQDDPRVGFRVFPKGERYGEAYRDIVLHEADEDVVCHLSDDDLWSRGHLAAMQALVEDADWGRQGVMGLPAEAETARWRVCNVGTAVSRRAIADMGPMASGINNVVYRREAYLRLAEGWTPAPEPGPSDLYMWAKFIRSEGLRVAASADATVLKLPSRGKRRSLTPTERAAMLGPWLARINDPAFLRDTLRQADMLRGFVALFAYSEIDAVETFENAMTHCGLRMVAPGEPTNVAVDGAPMHVPMSPRHRRQGACAFLLVKAAMSGEARWTEAWSAFAGENRGLARRALRDLGTLPPPLSERAKALGAI